MSKEVGQPDLVGEKNKMNIQGSHSHGLLINSNSDDNDGDNDDGGGW